MIKGINHITFSVSDLQRSFDFYQGVLDFKPLMKNARSAYFLAGDLWFCIEEDKAFRTSPHPDYTHVAFSIDEKDFENFRSKIEKSHTRLFKENKSEGESLYFLDPDGHKLEVHVGSLDSRMESYKKHSPPGMQIYPY